MSQSILYSFRRCPYAIRARLALSSSQVVYEHREILLKNKPLSMLKISPKGTVPVLVLENKQVIEESLDIMYWALHQNDPKQWLVNEALKEQSDFLIQKNDVEFKSSLDKYKYFERFPEFSKEKYRQDCEVFFKELEVLLTKNGNLISDSIKVCDMAILPFIRQFAHADKECFFNSSYTKVIEWLNNFLESSIFKNVMQKHPVFEESLNAGL